KIINESYDKEVSFSYLKHSHMKQYAVKFYKDGETELLSTFFEHLFIDARIVLTEHRIFPTKILTILEK
ncbi:MAG: hypothetical protein LBP87_07660, partial [Planctomycetaceae bacterium]|nr:hypothetical protein [Planctomycetaceae bacterium]